MSNCTTSKLVATGLLPLLHLSRAPIIFHLCLSEFFASYILSAAMIMNQLISESEPWQLCYNTYCLPLTYLLTPSLNAALVCVADLLHHGPDLLHHLDLWQNSKYININTYKQ